VWVLRTTFSVAACMLHRCGFSGRSVIGDLVNHGPLTTAYDLFIIVFEERPLVKSHIPEPLYAAILEGSHGQP